MEGEHGATGHDCEDAGAGKDSGCLNNTMKMKTMNGKIGSVSSLRAFQFCTAILIYVLISALHRASNQRIVYVARRGQLQAFN